MATFFGEVIQISSRAFDAEEEDCDETYSSVQCSIKWSPSAASELSQTPNGCFKCKVLLLGIGHVATAFIETYVMHEADQLGVICVGEHESVGSLHRAAAQNQLIIVKCKEKVSPEMTFTIAEKVLGSVEPGEVCVHVLCSVPAAEYQSDSYLGDLHLPLLRSLTSTHYQGAVVFPYLEQPNVISGLPAQVLSQCHIHKIPAVLYVVYTEAHAYLDVTSIKSFHKVLSSSVLKNLITVNTKAETMLAHLAEQHDRQNSLYT